MSYNPYFNYVPQYPQYSYGAQTGYQMSPQQVQPGSTQIVYVNGEEGAKAYIVAPNSSILLMDSDSPKFYIKSANAQGQMMMRSFQFEEISDGSSQKAPETDFKAFATKEDLKELEGKILSRLDELKPKEAQHE